jgi:anti-anti-sigma regulatory factor
LADEDRIEVAVIDKTVYVKPVGSATQDNCLGLPHFLTTMYRQGCLGVTFDLKDCHSIDSTFLGVIATAAISQGGHGRKRVVVLNADERVKHELSMVGLMSVVAVKAEAVEPPEGLKLKHVDFVHFPANERKRIEMIRDLHQEMVKMNEKNRELFSSFVEMLNEELLQEDGAEDSEGGNEVRDVQ